MNIVSLSEVKYHKNKRECRWRRSWLTLLDILGEPLKTFEETFASRSATGTQQVSVIMAAIVCAFVLTLDGHTMIARASGAARAFQ